MQYKGQLEGFPQEIVEKMLDRQVEQGNKRDVTVFEDTNIRDVRNGGFKWDKTVEGHIFWAKILSHEQFNIFFDKYPKQNNNNMKKEFPLNVSYTDLQKIIDSACDSWKKRLASAWGVVIAMKQCINIYEGYYKEMRNACTSEQHKLFDEIFGKDEEYIPDGTPCLVTNIDSYTLRYANGTGEHYKNGGKSGDTIKWKKVIILNEEALKNLPVNE